MSRIDRVLMSEDWESTWGTPTLWALPRDVSNHFPLILKTGWTDWGPKPFWFNNYWIENRKLKKVVEDVWREGNEEGWMGVVLKNKLKKLKAGLRLWSKAEYGRLDERVAVVTEEIEELYVNGELGVLSIQEMETRKELFGELWKLLKSKEASIVQRSRSKWLKVGDAN